MTVGELALSIVKDHINLGIRSQVGILRARLKTPMTEAAARSAIRRARGQAGVKVEQKPQFEGWKFPKGVSQAVEPYRIDGPARVLVTSDWHCPYHDPKALAATFAFAVKNFTLTHAVLDGDIQDFYQVSRHSKNREMSDIVTERDVTVECMAIAADKLPRKTHKIFHAGNHDMRLAKFLWDHAAELSRAPELKLDRWLMMNELGYEYIANARLIIGDISGFHGHELNLNGNAVVPARGVFTKVLMNAFCAHLHRTSRYSEPVGDRSRTITTHTIGCLCDLEPEYAPYNKWNLGFAVIEVHSNGDTEFHNFSMDRGSYKPVEV